MAKKLAITAAIIAFLIIALALLFTSHPQEFRATERFYNCGSFDLPFTEEVFNDLEYMDVDFDVTLEKNAFGITKIDGCLTIKGEKYYLGDHIYNEGNMYYCSLKYESGYIDYVGLVFDDGFKHIRILYPYETGDDENRKHLWLNSRDSYNGLVETLNTFSMLPQE